MILSWPVIPIDAHAGARKLSRSLLPGRARRKIAQDGHILFAIFATRFFCPARHHSRPSIVATLRLPVCPSQAVELHAMPELL